MLLLGLRLDEELKLEFESNHVNELTFVENVVNFMEAIKTKKFEAILIDERNSKEDTLLNLITKITEFQKRVVIIILGETSNLRIIAGSIKAGAYDYVLKPESPENVVKIVEKSVKDYKILAERVDKTKSTIPTIPSGSPKHMQQSTQLSIPTIRHAIEYCSSFIYPPLNHFIQTYRPVRSDFHLIT